MLDALRSRLAAAQTPTSELGSTISAAEVEAMKASVGEFTPRSFELGALVADTLATGAVDRAAAAAWIDFTQSGPNTWRTLGYSAAEYQARLDGHFLRFEDVPWPAEPVLAGRAPYRVPSWEGEALTLDRTLGLVFGALARKRTLDRGHLNAALEKLPAISGALAAPATYLARRCDVLTTDSCFIRGWQTLVREALLPEHDVGRARVLIDDILASSLPAHLTARLARDYRELVAGAPELLALWPPKDDATYPIPPALLTGATGRFFAPWRSKTTLERQAVMAFLGHAWSRHTEVEVGRASQRLGQRANRVGAFLSNEHFLRALEAVWTKFEETYATPELLARPSFALSFRLDDLGFITGWSRNHGASAQLHRGVTAFIEKQAKTGRIGLKTCYASGDGPTFELS